MATNRVSMGGGSSIVLPLFGKNEPCKGTRFFLETQGFSTSEVVFSGSEIKKSTSEVNFSRSYGGGFSCFSDLMMWER